MYRLKYNHISAMLKFRVQKIENLQREFKSKVQGAFWKKACVGSQLKAQIHVRA